jgi:hypothetical protein
MPILTEPMKKYLLNDSKKGYTAEARSTYNRRIIEYAKKGIEDLALLAEKLPEELQAQIFNKETLRPLIEKVFTMPKIEAKNRAGYMEKLESMEEKRKRIIQLCYLTLDTIGFLDNAWKLAPDIMDTLTKAGLHEPLPTLIGVKAIYLAGFKQQT